MIKAARQINIYPYHYKILGLKFSCKDKPINEIIKLSKHCSYITPLTVNSLGLKENVKWKSSFKYVSQPELSSLLFKCLSYNHYTTPSIATLLCGLKPEKNQVWKTEDTYTTTVKNIAETASKLNYKTAVTMEKPGAPSFQNHINFTSPVENVSNINILDEKSTQKHLNHRKLFTKPSYHPSPNTK